MDQEAKIARKEVVVSKTDNGKEAPGSLPVSLDMTECKFPKGSESMFGRSAIGLSGGRP